MTKQDGGTLRPVDKPSLEQAIWQARIAQAEHSDVVSNLRAGDEARLALISGELKSLIDELPEDADQFYFTLVPGDPPRLWIDMVAFVVMDRDRKTYRFIRETRAGRQLIGESIDPGDIATKITNYIAHRIVERERALSGQTGYVDLPAEKPGAQSGESKVRGFTLRAMVLTFLIGLSTGALFLLSWVFFAYPWL